MKIIYLLTSVLSLSATLVTNGQVTDILNFNSTTGDYPYGSVILSANNKMLFGMTSYGGAYGYGSVFRVDTNGAGFSDLLDFNGTNGANPNGSLTLSGHTLFGMTFYGGAHDSGCIFSIDTNGNRYKDLFDFKDTGSNSFYPWGSLTLSGNMLFGMTRGAQFAYGGNIFAIDTDGTGYKELISMQCFYGSRPYGSLTLSVSGKLLYGMSTDACGDSGNIFSLNIMADLKKTDSVFTNLHRFTGIDGSIPYGSLVLSGSQLFGMTSSGGANEYGVIFSMDTNGTYFKDLLDFNDTNGAYPFGSLILSGNVLYGMTHIGMGVAGIIFSIDTDGSGYRNLYDFNGLTYGGFPYGDLTLSGNVLYGMTYGGGVNRNGVVFKLDTNNVLTSINQSLLFNSQCTVYPNPSNGIFIMKLPVVSGQSSVVEIYNVLGEKVYSRLLLPNLQFLIDISNQPDGVYLYKIITQNGKLEGEGKLILQK